MSADEAHEIANGIQWHFVGDDDVELVFQGQDDINDINGIEAEVTRQTGSFAHPRSPNSFALADDTENLLLNRRSVGGVSSMRNNHNNCS